MNENGRNGYDLVYVPKNRVSRGRKYLLLPFSMCILSKTLPNICSFLGFIGIRGKIIIQIFMRRSDFLGTSI